MTSEPADAFEDHPVIVTESMVAYPDMEPIVVIRWGDRAAQMSPDEAREFGRHFMEVAESAEHDSSVCRYFIEEMKLTPQQTMAVLGSLRVHRGTRR